MKIGHPSPEQLLLTQRPHYVMLACGVLGMVGCIAAVVSTPAHWPALALPLLWCGFSSGYGTMLFDRRSQTLTVSKTWWGVRRVQQIPFSDIRQGEEAYVDRNTYFKLLLRGGETVALSSSADMISNTSQVVDAVNEFLGVYARGQHDAQG